MKFSGVDSHIRICRFSDLSGNNSVPTFRVCWSSGSTKTGTFGNTKPIAYPEDGTESVPERSEKLHILMRLSAQESLVEFCHRESLKTYITTWYDEDG